ncbi:hypothetical protein DL769_009080 [Monosporascus sp. CRB-8-3]|nr:hypothetical protein DL769_009080 [Monosporascus sp. CRB-8-3]
MVLKIVDNPPPRGSELQPVAMEHTLRCNSLKCRKELTDRALVTTCSHIFCTDSCGTHLTNPDDAVITNLKPSEDYKTSVLSGLSPNIVVECASRALSFWAYQTTQEIVYQEWLGKALTEKYSNLSVHLDKSICVKLDYDELRKKHDELTHAFKDKNRKLLQTQELYDKLKRKAMLGQMQGAAEDAADSTLQAASAGAAGANGFMDTTSGHQTYQEPGAPYRQPHSTIPDIPFTPSTHRQRVGDPTSIGLSTVPGLVMGTPRNSRNATNPVNISAATGETSSNNLKNSARFPAVGLTSGLKVSHGGGSFNQFAVPETRPREKQFVSLKRIIRDYPSPEITESPLSPRMASSPSYYTTRVHSGANGQRLSTAPPQHLPPRWDEPTLAYGSPYGRSGAARSSTRVYQEMERGPARVPELDNKLEGLMRMREEESPHKRGFKKWFDKRDHGKTSNGGRPMISAPQRVEKVLTPVFPYTAVGGRAPPPRPNRPPFELSPAAPANAAAQEMPVVIKPENLGTAAQALRSNPVSTPELLSARKSYNRKRAVVEMRSGQVAEMSLWHGAQQSIMPIELPAELPLPVELSAEPVVATRHQADDEVKTARRLGMVISPDSAAALTSFPEPAFDDHHGAEAQRGDVESSREDAGSNSEPEASDAAEEEEAEAVAPKTEENRPMGVPQIVITEPSDVGPTKPDTDLLTPDYLYKRLLKAEKKRAVRLANALEPLALLLAEAGGVGTYDFRAQEQVLQQLVQDSARYQAVRPALDVLAHDRRVDPEDGQGLINGLCDVLAVRDEAKEAATHHKRKAKALEARLKQLQLAPAPEQSHQ